MFNELQAHLQHLLLVLIIITHYSNDQPKMSDSSKSITFSEDSLFEFSAANPTKTIICIHENVYDVTQFQNEHRGGEEALKKYHIKENTFQDATEAFEDVFHSMNAREMMVKYQIGTLEGRKKIVC